MIKEVYTTPPGKEAFSNTPQAEAWAPPPWVVKVALVFVVIFIGSCEWVRGVQ